MTITINPAPSVAVITGSTSTVCIGGTITLNDATSGGVWSSGNNAIALVDLLGNVTGNTAGVVPISYTITNSVGCSASAFVNITVTTPVNSVITPMGPTTFCTGGSVVLTGPSGIGYSYQWQVGGVNISGATTSSYFTTMGGNYSLILTSGSGCSSTSSMVTVTVNPSPIVAPTVSITASPGNILCVVPSPVTFTATSVNGGTFPAYDWFVNGAYVSTGANYTYTPANGDVVRCRLTSNYICAVPDTASASMTMTISPLMSPSVAIRTDPGQIVCKGNSVSFTAVPTYGGSAPIYLWTLNGVNVATGPIYVLYTPNTGDVIKCFLTSNYPCLVTNSAASSPVRITVENPSVNTVTLHVTQMSTLSGRPDTFSVVAPNGGGAPRFQWYVNGGAIPGATNSVWIVSTLNNGDVVNCSVTSSDPCASPNTAFSGGVTMNIGVNGVMNVNSNSNFTLAPNPNKGEFTITGTLSNSSDDRIFVKIVDILGQTIYSSTVHANQGLVNEHIVLPTSVANGMYLVNITSGENKEVYHVSVDR